LRTTAAALAGAPRPARMPLSLAPDLSVSNALWWTGVAAALLAAALVARERAARRAIGLSLLIAAGFEVVYGSRRGTASTAEIWGTEVPTATRRLRGTFVNPDHLALFFEQIGRA